MEKRIELERRGKKPCDIKELNLDNCRSTSILGLTDDFLNLETLSLINVGLTTLKGFPKLPSLKKLELSDNRISGGLTLLQASTKLLYLNLSGNKIKDLDALEPLKEFKNLENLDLFNNEVTSVDNYREKVFNLVGSLLYLDGSDRNDKELEESEDEELNGNDDDFGEEDGARNEQDAQEEDTDSDDDEDEEEDEEEDEVGLGLDAIYKDNLDEESDGNDYEDEEVEEEEEAGELDEESEEEVREVGKGKESARGKKRKHEDEEA